MSRRPPPPFLVAEVAGREWLTPRLARITLEGDPLTELQVTQPASSVRVLLPVGGGEIEIQQWDGNRFILQDGRRPVIRTLTPRLHDRDTGILRVDVVVHGDGAAARWAESAPPGSEAAVSGPARGYDVDPAATALVVGGDETAVPAASQILEGLRGDVEVELYLEVSGDEKPPLPSHPRSRVEWIEPAGGGPGQALADRLADVELPDGAFLWAAGEAAAMQRIRKQLLHERNLPRDRATIRGYWKRGQTSDTAIETTA